MFASLSVKQWALGISLAFCCTLPAIAQQYQFNNPAG